MKIIDETLKNPKTGEWSRKNITSMASFVSAIVYAFVGLFFNYEVKEFIFIGFLSLTGSLLGISSWEKLNLKQNKNVES
jgi:hypothetical protein